MKIAISAGHSLSGLGSGAVGVVNESVEVRKIGIKVADLLKSNGQDVLYLQVDKADSYKGENYKTRVSQANNWGADLFVEIHLNCGGGYGTEVYTYAGKEFSEAKQILNNICSLGYRNRGIKNGNSLYVINNTKMKSCLVECFFCDSKSDVNLYNADSMAKAIAEGILGKTISTTNQSQPKVNPTPLKVIHDMVAMGLDKNGQVYPVKEFHVGDYITVQRVVNRLGELDINGVKAYITMGYTQKR